jgi:hypothetical protein
MNNHQMFGSMPDPGKSIQGSQNSKLAVWLQQVLEPTSQREASVSEMPENESQLTMVLGSDYHLDYYQQLPDFAMAMLTEDIQAVVRYSSLLYHLASCYECHRAYLDIYDALRVAIDPQGFRPLLGQGTRTLSATPHRMVGHFCQVLISQAEAVLRQARHNHTDQDDAARSLLQMALHVSAHITQSTIRRQALHDLVRVATLFEGPTAAKGDQQNVHAYTLAPLGRARRGRVLRRPGALLHAHSQEQISIEIQSNGLKGRIVQQGLELELHLQDLDATLRGRYLIISVVLGSLIEPVRWRNNNPQAIRSTVPVDASGTLITPLGETKLQLSNPKDRNLLEAIFQLLEVRESD